jgi:TatD DNase family protein
MLCDAHCHLESQEQPYPEGLLITAGYSVESSLRNFKIACGNMGVFCCVGISPQEAQKLGSIGAVEAASKEIWELLEKKDPKIVAVGEVGLDFHWGRGEGQKGLQRECFSKMLGLAKKFGLPAVIHCREAEGDALYELEKAGVRFMMHCFSGKAEDAKKVEELGGIISIPPQKSKERKKAIKLVGADRLVAESDSPAIGKSPAAALEAAGMIAEYRGMELQEAERLVLENTKRFFGIGGGMTSYLREVRSPGGGFDA